MHRQSADKIYYLNFSCFFGNLFIQKNALCNSLK